MPTFQGRRALAACLLALFAWLLAAPLAAASPADPPSSPPDLGSIVAGVKASDPAFEPATSTTTPPADPTTSTTRPATTTTRPATTTTRPAAATSTTAPASVRVASAPAGGVTAGAPATAGTNTAGTNTAGAPAGGTDTKASVSFNLDGVGAGKPSQSLMIIVLITLLSVAPALLIMLTSFTRIVIVLSLTRNALGLHTIPPNQVIVGLAMFLSFFVMSPTFSDINKDAVQPLLHGQKTQAQAYDSAVTPLRTFMLKQTRKGELAMFSSAANGGKRPAKPEDVGLAALIPAFILSELKTAFIIGFVVFIPFLVIDIVVSSSLMSMGMMMLPPVFVSLPFKLLLFVMVDGWGLIVRSLLKSFA
ncbi:MAG: flagellar biosynthesis protein FliP [Actinomycetota bacterium]|jgi:flagellar biosynthetic protein FliP|nr:flagellar biosynthesis protein FliP [Actinomycetota bacterium]